MVFGVDPGGTTGIAVWDSKFVAPALKQYDSWLASVQYIANFSKEGDWIVCERFDLRSGVRTQQLDPLYAIGALHLVAEQSRVKLVLQTPAQGKSFGTDTKLATVWGKDFGRGKPHAKDAARHLITFLCTYGEGRALGGEAILNAIVSNGVYPYAPEGWQQGDSSEPPAH